MINLVSLLPIRIWPEDGGEVMLKGIGEAEAIELLKDTRLRCYINNPVARLIISNQTGVAIKNNAGRCPLPRPGIITISAVIGGLADLDYEAILAEAEKDNPNLPTLTIKWVVVEIVNRPGQDP